MKGVINNMKKYNTPEIKVTMIEQENVIMLSGLTDVKQDGVDKPYGSIVASQLKLNS